MIPMNIMILPPDYLVDDYLVGGSIHRVNTRSQVKRGRETIGEHVKYIGEWGSLICVPTFRE